MQKKKLTVYVTPEVHERLIQDVLERVNKEQRFRGLLSRVVEEIFRNYYEMEKNTY